MIRRYLNAFFLILLIFLIARTFLHVLKAINDSLDDESFEVKLVSSFFIKALYFDFVEIFPIVFQPEFFIFIFI
jgi:nitrogen fixation/metabolism regulation signal transduction histidine kinase